MLNSFIKRFRQLLIFIITGITLLFFYCEQYSSMSSIFIFEMISIDAILIFVFFYNRNYENWFRTDVLFILGFIVVHLQWPLLFCYGIIPKNASRIWYHTNVVNYGTWLSTIGLGAWMFGYESIKNKFEFRRFRPLLIAEDKNYKSSIEHNLKPNTISHNNLFELKRYLSLNINYLAIRNLTITFFFLFLLSVGSEFLNGKFLGTSNWNAGSTYFYLIFGLLINIVWIIELVRKKNNQKISLLQLILKTDKILIFVTITYLALFLSIGERGGPLQLIFIILIVYSMIYRPIKKIELIGGIIAGAFFFSIISIGRAANTGTAISSGFQNFKFSGLQSLTVELADSVRTLYRAIANVPEHHYYFMGKLWLNDILSIIPFLQNILTKFNGLNTIEMSSANYITFLTLGKKAISGEGTTLIGDIFMNFGLPGILLFMYLLGCLFSFAQFKVDTLRNFNWLIIHSLFASFAIYISRGSLTLLLRPILWSLLLLWIFKIIRWKRKESYL